MKLHRVLLIVNVLLTVHLIALNALPGASQDTPIGDSLTFDPVEMRRLYNCGYQLAAASQGWADVPPVLDASQQSIPRAGSDFLAPNESVQFLGASGIR